MTSGALTRHRLTVLDVEPGHQTGDRRPHGEGIDPALQIHYQEALPFETLSRVLDLQGQHLTLEFHAFLGLRELERTHGDLVARRFKINLVDEPEVEEALGALERPSGGSHADVRKLDVLPVLELLLAARNLEPIVIGGGGRKRCPLLIEAAFQLRALDPRQDVALCDDLSGVGGDGDDALRRAECGRVKSRDNAPVDRNLSNEVSANHRPEPDLGSGDRDLRASPAPDRGREHEADDHEGGDDGRKRPPSPQPLWARVDRLVHGRGVADHESIPCIAVRRSKMDAS